MDDETSSLGVVRCVLVIVVGCEVLGGAVMVVEKDVVAVKVTGESDVLTVAVAVTGECDDVAVRLWVAVGETEIVVVQPSTRFEMLVAQG